MSTSKLQKYVSLELSKYLGEFSIVENSRPGWLEGLELDFYLPEIQVGIEVQGNQHFYYTPRFHADYKAFLNQKNRDQNKKRLCEDNNVKLYEVLTELDADILIIDLFKKHCSKQEEQKVNTFYRMSDKNPRLLKIKKILKSKHIEYVDKAVAGFIKLNRKTGVIIEDADVIDYYLKRKEFIDIRINKVHPKKDGEKEVDNG